ncbi:polar amino acid transport system substrate-binding protein [Undibacterium sp. GrIS 1.2]|uniref:substrate-binding periplasmic protein n=1 Tax=Undibacterium sp. GrIS 1.2 TaxID=3143933 RepID=UPI003394D55B
MKIRCIPVTAILMYAFGMSPIFAADNSVMRLASLEWAPYVGSRLHQEGLTAGIVKVAARQIGMDAKISYSPWSRTVYAGLNDPNYAGYFPAFYLKEREKTCYFSGVLGHSVVGFAHLKERPFQWTKLNDLRGIKIGIVQDYANGEEFDAMVKQRVLDTDAAPSDVSNLRKLLAHRVDVIVIDKYVLHQLLASEPSLQADKNRIEYYPHELAKFSMHICFQRNERGLAIQKAFNLALNKIDTQKLEDSYFQQLDAAQK